MYSLNMPVSRIRTKIRQEYERHRYVQQLPTVDVLITKSQMEYQVRRQRFDFRSDVANRLPGNAELLEAAEPCAQVLWSRRERPGPVAEGLHQRIFGGEYL
jgi:hypothetical protein